MVQTKQFFQLRHVYFSELIIIEIFDFVCKTLEKDVADETDQPEDKDEDEEKYGVDHPQEGLADLSLQSSNLFTRGLCQRLPVGLHQDVHEGLEEAEDQPAVDHLDVGGVGEVGTHTNYEYCSDKKV